MISNAINECLENDYRNTKFDALIEDEQQSFWENTSFQTLGFLADALTKIIAVRTIYSNEPWIVSELRVSGENFSKLTMKEAITQINTLFTEQQKPVIFFDECHITTNSRLSKQRYAFTRSLLRKLGLFTIFMGTDPSLMNFESRHESGYDRLVGDTLRPWCYIIHGLELYPEEPLDDRIFGLNRFLINRIASPDKCGSKLIPSCMKIKILDGPTQPYNTIERFIKFIHALLKTERPQTCHYLLQRLQCHFQLNRFRINLIDTLEDAIFTLFQTFMETKKPIRLFSQSSDYNDYNHVNLAIIFTKCSTKLVDIIANSEKTKCIAIHKHIAYLNTNNTIEKYFPTFFGLCTDNTGDHCLMQKDLLLLDCNKFKVSHSFASFDEEPLSLLSFIGIANYEEIFVNWNKHFNIRSSLTRVVLDCITESESHNITHEMSHGAFDGSILEDMVSGISLLSTHSNGFRGLTFENWLSNFISEFYFDSIADDENKRIKTIILAPNNNDEFWLKNKDYVLPFCSPSLNTTWASKMAEYLNEIGCKIGVCNLTGDSKSRDNKSRDFTIDTQHSNDNSSVHFKTELYGKCKLRQSGLNNSNVADIIAKSSNFSDAGSILSPAKSKWSIIVAYDIDVFDYTKFTTEYCKSDNIKPVKIYYLTKIELNIFKLELVFTSQANDKGYECQGFVLIDIKIIDDTMCNMIRSYFNV